MLSQNSFFDNLNIFNISHYNRRYFMKKLLFPFSIALLLGMTIPFSGCNTEKTQQHSISQQELSDRTVQLDKCGLQYEAPQQWIDYEQTNMLPITNTTTEGDIYAQIQYNYVTDKEMEALSTLSNETSVQQLLHPFGEILVFKQNKLESEAVQKEFALYQKQEKVASQKDYVYYMLSEYTGDISSLQGQDLQAYQTLSESMQTLKQTITVYPFDETIVAEAIDQIRRTISFVSTTLEGEPIDSSIFANADITVVNFWASYCYPNINETATLQQLKTELEQKYNNVQLIQVVIDTPQKEAEQIAKQAKQEANADFTSIMTDETLANWIVQNLEGLPTTILVNNQAQVIGEHIQGIQSVENYMNIIESALAQQEE